MIALDTNILVYAHRNDSPWHSRAQRVLADLSQAKSAWAIPWHCLHEFLGIVTHPRIFKPPTPLERALEQVEIWMESPFLLFLTEEAGYWKDIKATLEASRVTGPRVHDAHVAAICRHHGVEELWSADRDFGRFPGVRVHNPLIPSQ